MRGGPATHTGPVKLLATLLLAVTLAVLATDARAAGHGGGDERARVDGTCSGSARSELRLESDDGLIELEFEVDRTRSRASWRIVLVHERRVAWKGTVRARSGGSIRLRRMLPDLPGADSVTARAWGPNGIGCRAAATLRAS